MRAALLAKHLSPLHSLAGIILFINIGFSAGFEETGPTGARLELVSRKEERETTAHADVHAGTVIVPVAVCECELGAFAPSDSVFEGRKFAPPLFFGLVDLLTHSY